MKHIIDRIKLNKDISKQELEMILRTTDKDIIQYLFSQARELADEIYGKKIYVRGLIEFTNYCKNNCLYCGIRRANASVERYRLAKGEILECCRKGYELGFRTFVLQGGEDVYYSDEVLCDIVATIREKYCDCAITLSVGERSRKSYKRLFDAGANRYLLRHETADDRHYGYLHPAELTLKKRIECLWNLKEIGYQVGCGFMVGSPKQSVDTLYKDLQFIRKFKPHMVGIGPFIPQQATPFSNEMAGTLDETLKLLSIIRLLQPNVLLPATTALGTIDPLGRELGIRAGANVVMPNLSPVAVREKYALYDNKLCTGEEAAECKSCLQQRIKAIGYEVVVDRGDFRILGENPRLSNC